MNDKASIQTDTQSGTAQIPARHTAISDPPHTTARRDARPNSQSFHCLRNAVYVAKAMVRNRTAMQHDALAQPSSLVWCVRSSTAGIVHAQASAIPNLSNLDLATLL